MIRNLFFFSLINFLFIRKTTEIEKERNRWDIPFIDTQEDPSTERDTYT